MHLPHPHAVFVGYACDVANAFSATTGASAWSFYDGCEGGGGATTALYQGRVYLRDSGHVLDQQSGQPVAANPAFRPQTFRGNLTYFLNGSTLNAVALGSNATKWTFAGDGGLNSDPIEANGYVFVGSSSGKVYALRAASGAIAWTSTAGAPITRSGDGSVTTGMAIGDGLLVVPAGSTLVAFK